MREDWDAMVDAAAAEAEEEEGGAAQGEKEKRAGGKASGAAAGGVPSKPTVEVRDFVEVMMGAQGVTADALRARIAGDAASTETAAAAASTAAAPQQQQQVPRSVGVVPPRREIEYLRRYYRNEAGIKNEFQQARIRGN